MIKKIISIICVAIISIIAYGQIDTIKISTDSLSDDSTAIVANANINGNSVLESTTATTDLYASFFIISCFFVLLLMVSCLSYYKTYKYTSYWDEIKGHSLVNLILSIAAFLFCITSILLI